MGDLALNVSGKTRSKKSVKSTQSEAEIKVQRKRADAAEARVQELENAPVLLAKLDSKELSSMVRQKNFADAAVVKANELAAEIVDARVVALMMTNAYNASWVDLKKKYGFPEDVDVDWVTGDVFRKKISIQVDSLKES